jgi:hypothetical protein
VVDMAPAVVAPAVVAADATVVETAGAVVTPETVVLAPEVVPAGAVVAAGIAAEVVARPTVVEASPQAVSRTRPTTRAIKKELIDLRFPVIIDSLFFLGKYPAVNA